MNKEECYNLAELICVTWGKPADQISVQAHARGLWEFAQDLDVEECKEVVRREGMTRQWMLKPGELRMIVLSGRDGVELPPTAEMAWADLQHRAREAFNGTTDYEKAHPLLEEVMNLLGGIDALGLRTNGDRDMFTRLYNERRQIYLLEMFDANTSD